MDVVSQSASDGIPGGSRESNLQPTTEEILAELEKMLSSQEFRTAEGQRAFLRYVVEQSLQGHGDQIKEYTIGLEVFHRSESFDPRRDNTVRVKARRLRGTLERYYEGEGSEDPVRIEFPTGSYKPLFRFAAPSSQPESLTASGLGEPFPPSTSSREAASTELPAAEVQGTRSDELRASATRKSKWQVLLAVPVLFIVIASLAYVLKYRLSESKPASDIPSIAVLPFRFLSNEKQEEFFSDGLTDDLIDSLAQMPGIRVVGPTSVFLYKGKAVDIRKVGKDLNVGAVLEGTVRRVDSHLRITAQLSDAASGLHIWSSSYDREVKDVLAIQHEIAGAITNALGVKLEASNRPGGVQSSAPPKPEAYEDYLKGRFFWSKSTLKDFETAITYFGQAIAKDPSYAPSYVGLAHCYSALPNYTNTSSNDTIPKIRENASKALALDSTLGEAHVDLARAYTYQYEWPLAEKEFKIALELSPGVAVVHQRYGTYLMQMGRYPEAMTELQRARMLDPVSPTANTTVARPFYFMRRYDDALKQYKEALELDPNSPTIHEYIGIVYVLQGVRSRGIEELSFAHDHVKDNVWYAGLLGWANAVDGRKDAAQEILTALLERASHDPSPAIAIAHVYMGLGNKDKAFQWLRKAFDSGNANLFLLKIDPMWDAMRGDPRFTDLLRRMNLS
jgi:TolB-like protein/Tfp pilus assembly protein PilF